MGKLGKTKDQGEETGVDQRSRWGNWGRPKSHPGRQLIRLLLLIEGEQPERSVDDVDEAAADDDEDEEEEQEDVGKPRYAWENDVLIRVRSMTGKAPKSSRNDCSMTPKSSEKLASPASPEKLASFSELFRLSSNAP